MSTADKVGTARYWQMLGQSYAEMLRGSMTASGIVTAAAAWLGLGKGAAIALGAGSILFWQLLAVGFGYVVWRWRVIHKTQAHEWENDPYRVLQISLLREIATCVRPQGVPTVCPRCAWDFTHVHNGRTQSEVYGAS